MLDTPDAVLTIGKMKRTPSLVVCLFVGLVMGALLLTGCSGSGSDKSSGSTTTTSTPAVTTPTLPAGTVPTREQYLKAANQICLDTMKVVVETTSPDDDPARVAGVFADSFHERVIALTDLTLPAGDVSGIRKFLDQSTTVDQALREWSNALTEQAAAAGDGGGGPTTAVYQRVLTTFAASQDAQVQMSAQAEALGLSQCATTSPKSAS